MTHTSLFLSALIGFTFLSPVAVQAQDKAATPVEKSIVAKPTPKEGPQPGTPLAKWIDAENALIDPLNDKDKESFFILRNKYSVLRVIRVVERDVGGAVKSCGAKNPDMKEKMDARYKQWQGAVDPILDTAKTQLDKDIENQKIVDAKKAKEVLKLNDEAYEAGEKQITKTPVTTKEACNDLLGSMDRTEDDMVQLLQQTLLPESVIRKRGAEVDKAKAAAAAKAKRTPKPGDVPAAGAQSKPAPSAKPQ